MVQWRFKIKKSFAIVGGVIMGGDMIKKLRYVKPRPKGTLLYKKSAKKYDYFDYNGERQGEEIDFSDITRELIALEIIKFIDNKECDKGSFK